MEMNMTTKPNLKLVKANEKARSTSTKAKQAVDAPRGTIFMMIPEDLVIVGVDVKDDGSVFNDERLELPLDEVLLDSILRFGVKKNVVGRKNSETGKVEVTDGRQRTLCARKVNEILRERGEEPMPIPVRIERGSDDLMFDLQISLNHHVPSTPLMKARAAERYRARGKSDVETCRIFGISQATLQNWMDLLNMDEDVHKAVDSGKISSFQALKFSKLSRVQQKKAVQRLVEMKERKQSPAETSDSTPSVDKIKIPSKADLVAVIGKANGKVSEDFILGLKFALGEVGINDVPGLKEALGKK